MLSTPNILTGVYLLVYNESMFKLRKLPATMNAHQLHLKSGVTYATVLQYMNEPETVKAVDLATLYRILHALELDLSELRFLDVFTTDDLD